MEYDLSAFHARDTAVKRPTFYIALAIIVGFSLEAAYLGFLSPPDLLTASSSSAVFETQAGVVATLGFFVAFFAISLPRFLEGAIRVRVDTVGCELIYPAGRVDRVRWDDPRDEFYIQDYSAYPREVARGRQFFFYFPTWSRLGRDRRTWLTPEAAKAIIEVGIRQKAEYRTWNGSSIWNGRSPVIHSFRGSPRSSPAITEFVS
jgi:hypothetical protein